MKKKIIKLNEKDIERLVEKIIKEENDMLMGEDSEGEETYNYDQDLHHDSEELHDLEHKHGSKRHIRNLKKDMDYDEKRGVGKNDKWRRERGTHFNRRS